MPTAKLEAKVPYLHIPVVILSLPLLSPRLAVVNVAISTSVTTFPCLGRLWRREVFRLNQHGKFSSLAIGLLP